jgi:hypothetical protein
VALTYWKGRLAALVPPKLSLQEGIEYIALVTKLLVAAGAENLINFAPAGGCAGDDWGLAGS